MGKTTKNSKKQSKKNQSKAKNSPKPQTGKKKTEEGLFSLQQKIAIVTFASAILFLSLALIEGRSVWLFLHNALLGIFGYIIYLIPIALLYITAALAFEKKSLGVGMAVAQSLSIMSFVAAFVHLLANDASYLEETALKLQFKDAYVEKLTSANAGAFGAFLGGGFAQLFGKSAALIILGLAIFVVLMIALRVSIVSLYKYASKPVKKVGEMVEKYKEEKSEVDLVSEETDEEVHEAEPEPVFVAEEVDDDESDLNFAPFGEKKTEGTFQELDFDFNASDVADRESGSDTPKTDKNSLLFDDKDKSVEIVAQGYENKTRAPIDFFDEAQDNDIEDGNKRNRAPKTKSSGLTKPEADFLASAENTYALPPYDLLSSPPLNRRVITKKELEVNAQKLIETLDSFGVKVTVSAISRGPSVTRYELHLNRGTKISRVTSLADDIALALAAVSVRIAPIPNKSAIGIEIPNRIRENVYFREVVESQAFRQSKSKLTIALGKDISGKEICTDLEKMPHLLIAGTTGSGKSVCMNSLIQSLLFNATPDEVKLLLIDVKGGVELGAYNGIAHLAVPVVTEARKAAGALSWAVSETGKRYKLFELNKVRNITGYNALAEKSDDMEKLYRIVIFIDELNDLMMVAPNEVEDSICRIAQLARAAGIHLVVATQRPSVDVITGVIKANIPSRIALSVASQVDSRTILDSGGAEKLLGNGDMLFSPVGTTKSTRIQGCFVSDHDILKTVKHIKAQTQADYSEEIIEDIAAMAVETKKRGPGFAGGEQEDELLPKAIELIVREQTASTTFLQRKLRIGYARAANIIDRLEAMGIVGPAEGSKPRAVLLSRQEWLEKYALSEDENAAEDE
ncbi:MAG: DNA translocase FtsK [Clostridiales bacterium]|nr:DNA translocase FtsK [Clostridiales bacterium]